MLKLTFPLKSSAQDNFIFQRTYKVNDKTLLSQPYHYLTSNFLTRFRITSEFALTFH
jgi:hypothetical protein